MTITFQGGTILTGPLSNASAVEAVTVSDGVVVRLEAGGGEVVDLGGGFLLPAFRDGHAHPLWGGLELNRLPLDRCSSATELVAAVAAYAAENPQLSWVVGGPYDPTLLPDGLGDASLLDTACRERPVVLYATDHHTMWVNTVALHEAGITSETPDPPLGLIIRSSDGSPRGTLLEWDALALVEKVMPQPSLDEHLRGLERACEHLNRHGIVWAQDAAARPDQVRAYAEAARRGVLTCRFNTAFWVDPSAWREQRAEFLQCRKEITDVEAFVTARTVKFFADGVIEQGTGQLLAEYDDAPGSVGLPNFSAEELSEAVRAFDEDGFQIHIHAIGDAAIQNSLNAIAYAAEHNGPSSWRPVIAHTQLLDPADLPRFGELGVIANFEPYWAKLDELMVELTLPRIGVERGDRQYPMATIARLGGRISFGSDWPVSEVSPTIGCAVAASRQLHDGTPPAGWVPGERLGLMQALEAYTKGTAYQAFDDDAGEISLGQRADFALLDVDPRTATPVELWDARVLGTWLGGRRVYSA